MTIENSELFANSIIKNPFPNLSYLFFVYTLVQNNLVLTKTKCIALQ